MSVQEILTEVLDKVSTAINLDAYLKELKNIILKDIEGEFITFTVHKSIYDLLDNKELKSYLKVSEDSEIVIRFALSLTDGLLFFTLKYVDNLLFMELKKELLDKVVSTIYVKFADFSRVETTEVTKDNGFYEDYHCGIYYYDADFNLVSEATDEEKDAVFGKEFNIPKEFVRFFRLNFKRYAKEISRYVSSKQMENADEKLSEKDFWYFLAPFNLNEFSNFINREYSKKISAAFKMVNGYDYITIYNNEFKTIEENLISQIGTDGEVIISSNIYQNLINVLLGVTADGISTNGYIIKKSNGVYTLYDVNITNNHVLFFPRVISDEEIKRIYYSNDVNQNVEGLAEFFGVTRGR